ncbi:hypothetical protein GA707_08100 [Nostocoides sp. F2B08]|uniref:hypothetical protein n=1 Tax=Nostocoides sp. F2B08 TaxID=2653936 RepID=UPI00126373A7|nr:hypothetical protein [Tetrasphaera sp. F2B08]KAB7744560.1 hypothetical protein GA707_08100 [Tetrasphaera sp. F2B08]
MQRIRRAIPWIGRRDAWDLGAAVMILVFLGAVLWLVGGGGLYIDDIRAQAYAADRSMWPFIVESNQTHLAYSARTVDWLQATYAPLEHWPAVVLTLVIAGTLGVFLWIACRSLIGHPAAALVGVYLGLFTATIVPTLAWFRQSLTGLASITMTLVVLTLAVRYVRGGSRWVLAATCVLHVVALGFSERALVAPIFLLGILVFLRPADTRPSSRRAITAVVGLGLVNVGFLVAYLSGDFDRGDGTQPSVTGFITSTGYSLLGNTVPAYLGGPWTWYGDGSYGYADTSDFLIGIAGLVLVVLLVFALLHDARRAGRVVAAAASFVVPLYALIYVGRVARVDEVSVVDDLRLHTDAAIIGAVAVAALLSVALAHPVFARRGPRLARAIVMGVVAVIVVSGTVASWSRFVDRWHTNDSDVYLESLRAELPDTTGTIVPGPVPEALVPWWVQPDFSTQPLVRLMSPRAETVVMRDPARAVGYDGHLVDARLMGLEALSSSELCVLNIPSDKRAGLVQLVDPIPPRRHQLLEIGLLVGDTTRVGVAVIDSEGTETPASFFDPPLLHRGPTRILATIPVNTTVTGVVVTALDRNTTGMCITSVTSVLARATL